MLDGNSNESLNDRGKFCTVVTRDEFPTRLSFLKCVHTVLCKSIW